ncbi:type IV pilin [Natrinema ejinorense]|uniref:Archaeal Type IV pilin N-terminal domain-containing protein n=1 Tax=Natrinema ejinorense TaxID=373386 RepID=A0A2A5QRQ6_9EURY|nr:type IV pilin [Natrinema ejinorense]PCR89528.1 hypothetical protein CP557_02660 [Natrinema ejinorense]
MQSRRLPWDERAVSPVIGTVLLVGIVAMTMTLLGTALFGGGLFEQSSSAEFTYQTESGTVKIGVTDVRGLSADDTEIRIKGGPSCGTWDGSGSIEKGDVTEIDSTDCSFSNGDVIQIVTPDRLLDTYEVRGT